MQYIRVVRCYACKRRLFEYNIKVKYRKFTWYCTKCWEKEKCK